MPSLWMPNLRMLDLETGVLRWRLLLTPARRAGQRILDGEFDDAALRRRSGRFVALRLRWNQTRPRRFLPCCISSFKSSFKFLRFPPRLHHSKFVKNRQ